MTWLELWTQTPVAKALGWTLVHSLWEGVLVALLFAGALTARRSPRARYGAACLALMAILGSFVVTLVRLWPAGVAVGGTHAAVLAPRPFIDPSLSDSVLTRAFHASDVLPWLAPFWILGVLAFHLRALAGWVAARRMRRSGVCCAAAHWTDCLDRLARRIRISRPVTLFESSLADAPLVIGYLRPIILMPVGLLAGLPLSQVEAILAHELAHIRRQDYLVNLIQTFVEGLLFYHPAVWWISHVIRAEREHCCDDLAVAVSGDAREYAAALTALEQNRFSAREPALAATGGSLVKRIRRILNKPQGSRVGIAPLASTMLLLLATAAGLAAWQSAPTPASSQAAAPQASPTAESAAIETTAPLPAPPTQERKHSAMQTPIPVTGMEQENEALGQEARRLLEERPRLQAQQARREVQEELSRREQQAQAKVPEPYRKWLNEDAAYIITDQERAEFKALQADAQRESFIDQFWQRRDPTPGTPENEFKQEHYRRIAYVNEHFASFVPGWKTDRGRIYITYGPPDEIEDHSAGGFYQRPPAEGGGETTTVPFQQWRYRYIEGVGNNIIIEFIDPNNTHEFRMTSDPAEKDALRSTIPPKPGNSFISVGGDPQVTVSAGAGGAVTVFIEQTSIEGTWNFVMSVTANGKTVANARDHIKLGPTAAGNRYHYNNTFRLAPGSYTVNVVVQDPAGLTQTKTVAFYVN